MPLYSDMYYNYLNSVPPSVTSSYSSYSSSPSVSSNYSSYSTASSSYSLSSPSYSSPSYSSPSYSSLPYTPTIRSGVSRFMPKLTTISEAPLSKHRIAALSRMAASHNASSKYIPPRPRRMDTSDIDVSASRFENRRKSEAKPIADVAIVEESILVEKDENRDDAPIARSTIRRDRGLVRLRTVRITPDTKPVEPPKKPRVEQGDIDPGYGSSERSSGSWRKKFENELDLHEKPLSPTVKSLGESFIEKYTIKETPAPDVKVYLTIDDVPYEQRDFVRRKSAPKLPTFKEICSDISSDKLTDDLNAGDLRRRASLIIEEEMLNFTNIEPTNLESQKTNEDENANKNKSDGDGDDENETEPKHKNRKIKKKQRATSKTLLSEITEKVDETKETALDMKSPNETEIEICTFKVPLRKKKKVTDVVKTSTCDLNSTDMSTASHTQTPTELMTLNANENERKIAETHATEQKQPESLINIKSKQQQHSSDLDTKLLIAKNASPGVEQVKKNQKSSVNLKTSMKSDVKVPGKMYPLKREPSADDFWGMIGSRETTIFAKRKQQVIEEQQQKIIEIAWTPECEDENEENSSPDKVNNLKLDQKASESNRLKDTSSTSQSSLFKDSVDTKSYEKIESVGGKKISALVNENDAKEKGSKSSMDNDKKVEVLTKKVEPQKKLEAETKLFGNAGKSVAVKTVERMIEVKSGSVKIEKDMISQKDKEPIDIKHESKPVELLDSSKKLESEKLTPKITPKKPEVPVAEKQPQSPKKLESNDKKEAQTKKFDFKINKKSEVADKATISEESEKESEKKKKFEVSGKKMNVKELEAKKSEVLNEIELKGKKTEVIENKLNETVSDALKNKEIEQNKMNFGLPQPSKDKLIKIEAEKPVELPKVDDKLETTAKIEPKVLDAKKSPTKAIQKTKSDGVSKIGTKVALPEAEKKADVPKAVEIQKIEEKVKPKDAVQSKPLATKKSPTKKPEADKLDTKKVEEKIADLKKSPPKTFGKAKSPEASKLFEPIKPEPTEPLKPAVTKKQYGKTATTTTDKKTETKPLGNKETSDNKSLASKDGVKSAVAETSVPTVVKKLSPQKDTKSLINQSTSVNDQEKKSKATTNDDGIESKKKKQIEEVLNENQTIELNSTTSNNNKISPTSLSKKSFGTLSKFPTLNNLNSIAMNDAVEDNKTTNDNNQSIASEQLNESEQEKISIALEPSQVTASEQQKQTKESQESETEEEESSYEEESSEEEEDMGKKDFDPQKKVKIDFTSMQKFFKTEEKSNIKLVARPRPLWKIKRNRHAKFSSSESESDDEEVEEICGGDSATGGSQSSTNSEKVVKPVLKNKSSGNEISTEHIVALMENLNLNEENEDNDNASEDAGKKKQTRFSTSSHDSGYSSIGATAAKSPRKALDCDVNCHKKCEKLAANLCGVNQKLIVEAIATVRRENQERLEADASRNSRESLTPPILKPTYQIEINHDEDSETSYTYTQFQKTGKMTAPATVIPRFRKYSVEDFHFLTVLGKGSFGKVFLAELKNTSYYYAVKCLKKDVVLEDDDVECTLIERKVLALGTRHPYLCHLFCTFQTDSHLFFVMEYLTGGDLMFHIQQSGRFTEKRARFYAAEIVSGLKFLHRKGIIYRDLKLDNVLLDHDGHVRLADFGMCKLEIYLDKTADSFCGTPDYMPPEIIKGLCYNQSVDYWSFGVLLYEMLIGQSPFSGCDEDELFWSICNEIPWYPHFLSKESLKILQSLLEKDVTIRLGSMGAPDGDIKYHPFFAEISWEKLDRRELEPPFKPQVRHPLDTQYFDSQFTRERARLTPIDKNILISMDQKQFEGFSYTNPNATLTKLNEKKKKKEPKRPKFYFCPCCGEMKITETLY